MAINIDAVTSNADWTKHPSDLPDIKTQADLSGLLKTLGMTLDQFKALPIYKRFPEHFDHLP